MKVVAAVYGVALAVALVYDVALLLMRKRLLPAAVSATLKVTALALAWSVADFMQWKLDFGQGDEGGPYLDPAVGPLVGAGLTAAVLGILTIATVSLLLDAGLVLAQTRKPDRLHTHP